MEQSLLNPTVPYPTAPDLAVPDRLTAAQCRMARAGLGLSISEASKASQVSRASIIRFEGGNPIKPVLRSALRAAFERMGAVLTERGVDLAPGAGPIEAPR